MEIADATLHYHPFDHGGRYSWSEKAANLSARARARTDEELAEVLRGIRVPVLILAAMRDGVISPESALRAARSVPGATAVLFEDEGHFIGTESPERLVREVRVFVDELNHVAEPLTVARTGAGA
jgi:pimeloyl-ACP methyl ester carboxylesterase